MACDLEEEEGAEGEVTGDDLFDSGPGTSASVPLAGNSLSPINKLVEQITVLMENEFKKAEEEEEVVVVTEQVAGLQEHQRPWSELAGVRVVTEQPLRSEALPLRSVPLM